MKRMIILSPTDEELQELQRILLDEDRENALRFLKKHFADKVKGPFGLRRSTDIDWRENR